MKIPLHRIVFADAPEGQHKKTADNSKLRKLLPSYKFTALEEGIKRSVRWFCDNFKCVRR